VAVGLVATIVIVRLIFSNQFDSFKTSINTLEIVLQANFDKERENKILSLSDNVKIAEILKTQFDENKAIIERDTSFSFLYLKKRIKYKTYSVRYLDCLENKCFHDVQNNKVQKEIEGIENKLKIKFGEIFDVWYPELKDKIIVKNEYKENSCDFFFPDFYEISYKNETWKDFEKFMTSYNSEQKKANLQNRKNETQFSNNINSAKRQLNSNVISYFENRISSKKNELLALSKETKIYNSSYLGEISYDIALTKFNVGSFQKIVEDAFEEQWKNNSLRTGAMPYSNCYGSSNYCNGYGCSQIKVRTGGSGDVLVTIKNYNSKVVRHAFIKGGNSYTFEIPDGRYQVFFYSGKGWNPNKKMQSSSCNSLRGGFVSNEEVTKDNYIQLNGQIMTYELILQQQGNFSTKPSSKSEAF
jgi:hypothetical protein